MMIAHALVALRRGAQSSPLIATAGRAVALGSVFVALAGCSGTPFDAAQLKPPAAWTMAKKCALPKRPADDGDPVVRADYEAKLRRCAARRGDQVSGLQSYVRTATKK